MKLCIDLDQEPGFGLVLKDYQEVAMRYLWETDKGQSSRDVWMAVNDRLKGVRTISRASIINFLNAVVDDGFLDYSEITGKGGHRRIYSAAVNQEKFWKMIAVEVREKLVKAAGIPLFG